jgi:hypothetical protein
MNTEQLTERAEQLTAEISELRQRLEAPPPSERVDREFGTAVGNVVGHAKRSLLDCIDLVLGPPGARRSNVSQQEAVAALELMAKRIHNDVSMLLGQVMAAHSIYKSGGVIPPFGATEGQRASHAHRIGKS